MTRKNATLTVILVVPILALIGLVWFISKSLEEGSKMPNAPRVGAGAGDTGGANAVGELLAGADAEPPAAPASADGAVITPTAAQPNMVAPESLDQGFILVVRDTTGRATLESPIYLAGNINNWNPADGHFKLEPQSDQAWRIILPKPRLDEPMEFKFTRGSWELEELNADLQPIQNRRLPQVDVSKLDAGEQPRIEFEIVAWGDQRPDYQARQASDPYRTVQATGDLRRLQVTGGVASAAGETRDLLVWLPPGYDDAKNAGVEYPVLYLLDGQNVFENHPGIPAEWRADETAQQLITSGAMAPAIIVAVPHAGPGRNSEYMPFDVIESIPARGEEHAAWMLREVMPRVERAFRVSTSRDHTGIGGASLGGVMAVYLAAKHPDEFGIVLAESIAGRVAESPEWSSMLESATRWPERAYIGVGGKETGDDASRNAAYVAANRAVHDRYRDAGKMGPDRLLLIVQENAGHNEEAWAERLPQALTFLFPPPMTGSGK